jgi:hypothetical protein
VSVLQFVLADGLHVRIFVSSTKPRPIIWPESESKRSRRPLAKIRKRIGESFDPCGIPVWIGIVSLL